MIAPVASAQATAPTIEATWVESVTATSANLRAEIDPGQPPAHYHFEYLTEAAYLAAGESFAGASRLPAHSDALLPGAGTPVFQRLEGLAPETAYRYRVLVTNAASETAAGAALFFATEEPTNAHPPLDGRAYELVSPAEKDGDSVGAPEALFGGGDFQAAAQGTAFAFSSPSSFGEAAAAPPASQYLSTRAPSGWSTSNLSAPLESGGYGDRPDGVPFRIFSEDLSRALMLNGTRCAVAGTCSPTYSLWQAGTFSTLPTMSGLRLAGATPDLRHIVFEAQDGLYEWGGGALETLSPGPGAALAAPLGAISEDGRRVYAYQSEDGPISLYETGHPARALPETIGVAAHFQAASADGRFAFYTVGGALRRYDALGESVQTIAAGVIGVLGISVSGDTVYYQDGSGLERWHEGVTTTVVTGPQAAAPSDYPPATATARVSPDGQHLAFLSAAAIPPFDNDDAQTGASDTELYLYGPPSGGGPPLLVCASCNPSGERPTGSASIPGAIANGSTVLYRPRVLSAGGDRVFFDSADRLLIPDVDSRPDVYEWEADGVGSCLHSPGCTGLISGGRGEGGRFLDASESGDDAFFLSGDSLVKSDPGSIDVYDARVGGGFPEAEEAIPCDGDACQALPSPPEDPSPGTLVPSSGNPALVIEKLAAHRRACPEGRHRVRGKRGKKGGGRCVKEGRHPGHGSHRQRHRGRG